MIKKLFYLLIVSIAAEQWGCYPKGAEYIDEVDIVYTNYSSEFDFISKKTYAIPDSVIKITGDNFLDPDGDGKPQFMSPANAAVILTQINKNMQDYGWTRVDKNDNPDVILLASTNTTTNLYYYYDWSYWGWYYPGYYPGWGWGYGWYYPPYVTGYRSGSIFVQMVDHHSATPTIENVPVVWNCIINGLAEGGSASISARTQKGIDKAFSQSPYLKL